VAGLGCAAFLSTILVAFLSRQSSHLFLAQQRDREIRSAVAIGAGLRDCSSHGFDRDRSGGLNREIGERGCYGDLIHVASAKGNVHPARYRHAAHGLRVKAYED
jgi:hypothetical protein